MDAPDDPTRTDVFLLMGQSNMAGRGEWEVGDDEPVDGVFVLDGQSRPEDPEPTRPIAWRVGAHPLHLNEPQKNQFGMGLDFARRYRELVPNVTVGLVPCAWGGQPISVLGPGSPLYANSVARARIAAERGRLAGVLWHQGESDTASVASSEAYESALRAFIRAIRADLGDDDLAFVIGDLAPTLGSARDAEGHACVAIVRSTLRTVAETTPGAGWVSSHDLTTADDDTHFDRASLQEFGRRYADTAATLRIAEA